MERDILAWDVPPHEERIKSLRTAHANNPLGCPRLESLPPYPSRPSPTHPPAIISKLDLPSRPVDCLASLLGQAIMLRVEGKKYACRLDHTRGGRETRFWGSSRALAHPVVFGAELCGPGGGDGGGVHRQHGKSAGLRIIAHPGRSSFEKTASRSLGVLASISSHSDVGRTEILERGHREAGHGPCYLELWAPCGVIPMCLMFSSTPG